MWSCLGWWVRLHYESAFCKMFWLRKECVQNCPPLRRNFLQKLSVEWSVFFHSSQGKEKSCSTSEWVIWATSPMCNEPGRFTKTTLHPGTVGSSRDCLAPRLPSSSDTHYCCLMLGLHEKAILMALTFSTVTWEFEIYGWSSSTAGWIWIQGGLLLESCQAAKASWLYHILSNGALG